MTKSAASSPKLRTSVGVSHRVPPWPDLVRALLEHETVSGAEVNRLIEISRQPSSTADTVIERNEPAEVGSGDDT